MMKSFVIMALCAAAGAGVALQAPINARLRTLVQSAPLAALISFGVGMLFLVLIILATGQGRLGPAIHGPWWIWIGGLFGALYVWIALDMVPRGGAAMVVAASVLGQLIAGLLADSFGWFGLEHIPFNLARMAGAALLVIGVVLIQRH